MHSDRFAPDCVGASLRRPLPAWSLGQTVRLTLASLALTIPSPSFGAAVPDGVWVRPGYEMIVAVDGIKGPRFLAFSPDGALFVSVPSQGKIFRCTDADGDGVFEKATTFVQGKEPKTILQGMQFHEGWLWFAQLNSISRARDTNGDGRADEEIQVLNAVDLPTGKDGGHMWRALLIHHGRIEDGHPYGEQKIVDFLQGGTEVKGRPVDCAEAPDGSIVISDDSSHLVYRLRYVGR